MRGCRVARASAGKLPRVDVRRKCLDVWKKCLEILLRLFQYQTNCYVSLEVCLGCSYKEVLGESSSNHATPHHHVEAIILHGPTKKVRCEYQSRDVAIPVTKYAFYGKHICYMCHGTNIRFVGHDDAQEALKGAILSKNCPMGHDIAYYRKSLYQPFLKERYVEMRAPKLGAKEARLPFLAKMSNLPLIEQVHNVAPWGQPGVIPMPHGPND